QVVCGECCGRHASELMEVLDKYAVPPQLEGQLKDNTVVEPLSGEIAGRLKHAVSLILDVQELVSSRPELRKTLEGYARHLTRLADHYRDLARQAKAAAAGEPARIELAVWRGVDTSVTCSLCESELAELLRNKTGLFVIRDDGDRDPVCLNCVESRDRDLVRNWRGSQSTIFFGDCSEYYPVVKSLTASKYSNIDF